MSSNLYRGSVVVLFGPISSGKSTTANALEPTGFIRLSFADALREEVAKALAPDEVDKTVALMRSPETKEYYRPLLQWWGSNRRVTDKDYWVRKLLQKLNEHLVRRQHIVIDDCRYKNERVALNQYGATFFLLAPNPDALVQHQAELHESERDWRIFPYNAYLPWIPPTERADAIISYLKTLSLY